MNNSVNFTTVQSFGLVDYMEICIYGINFLVGLPTHSYVIWLIITGTGSGVASEFFHLNFSVCEIGNCLNSLFSALSVCFSGVTALVLVFQGLFFTGRSLFQCLMCVERYLAVVHPVTFLKYKPLRYRVICSAAAWITSLGSCLCCICITLLLNIQAYTCFFSLQFLLFFLIQLFCLVAVLRALKMSGPGQTERMRDKENHMKRRAFYLILLTSVNMAVIYLPFTVTGFFITLIQRNMHALWNTGLTFYVFAGFVQPVLFLHRTGKLSCLRYL